MHNTNDLVEIYEEWEDNKGLLGVAILQELKKEGLPFIPKYAEKGYRNSTASAHTVTYKSEKWKVAFLTLTDLGRKRVYQKTVPYYNIRFPYAKGTKLFRYDN